MSDSKCVRLTGPLREQLLNSVDTVLFDCDGVLWKGNRVIPGAPEVINTLRRSGKRVLFVTNNPTKTRDMCLEKLTKMGFKASKEDIFGTAYCTALFLKNVAKVKGKVYLIGDKAVSEELKTEGITFTGPGPDPVHGGLNDWVKMPLDPDVKAVVVGFDEHFSFMKLAKAIAYLKDPECLFVATNPDNRLPLEGGKYLPDTGCFVQAVETAAQRKPHMIGKPSRFIFDCILSKHDLDPARTVMVGDRLDTDILLGFNCSLNTILTLTGLTSLEEAKSYQKSNCPSKRSMVPDYYVNSITDLLHHSLYNGY
nr:PREDICTED: phosphoglycolate phosphatase [Latimeria chalumnae]|eukprot:XP_014343136.1 PREDICTED: phosphoglycolate phosphatase [Latimeria chalumnae]